MNTKKQNIFFYLAKDDYDVSPEINGEAVRAYSPKKLKELYPDGGCTLSGETWEGKKMDREYDIGRIELNDKIFYISPLGKHRRFFRKEAAYLATEDGGFLALLKLRALPFIVLAAGIAALIITIVLTAFFHVETSFTPVIDPNQTKITNNANPYVSKGETVQTSHKVPGFTSVHVSAGFPNVQLSNPDENQCLFKYTVTDEAGNILHESGWIEPGMATMWNAWESFGGVAGTYQVTILNEAQDPVTGAALNSVVQTPTVTLI